MEKALIFFAQSMLAVSPAKIPNFNRNLNNLNTPLCTNAVRNHSCCQTTPPYPVPDFNLPFLSEIHTAYYAFEKKSQQCTKTCITLRGGCVAEEC